MEKLITILISLGGAFAIAHFLGKQRQIGFGRSFFFNIFLSPIFGFIITMLSRKYYDDNPIPSKSKRIFGKIILVFSILGVLGQFMKLISGQADESILNGLMVSIGLIGLGNYLIELGKGKKFNENAITKV